MKHFVNINRSGLADSGGNSQISVYPPLVELQFTMGIPSYSQFDTYLVAATSEGMDLITVDDYFSRVGPPYDKVYALFCTDDASHPDLCKVVHYVARVEGLSKVTALPEVGQLCSAYLSVLIQPGQAPEIEYVGWAQLVNIKATRPETDWASGLIFRPSYDRAYTAPDSPDYFVSKWTREVDVVIYQGLAPGSATPTYQADMVSLYWPATIVNATDTGVVSDDSLDQGMLRITGPDGESFMRSTLFSLTAIAYPNADPNVTEFYWSCLQREGNTKRLSGRLLSAGDPTHPTSVIDFSTGSDTRNLSVLVGALWMRTQPG